MVRFGCFFTPSHYLKPKKVQFSDKMHSQSRKNSQDQTVNGRNGSTSTNPKTDDVNSSVEKVTSPSSNEDCWKLEDLNGDLFPEDSKEFLQMTRIKKSQSLGNLFDKERSFAYGDATDEDEVNHEYAFDCFHDKSMKRVDDSFNDNDSADLCDHENLGTDFHNDCPGNDLAEPFHFIADQVHHESLFSIDVLKQFDGYQHTNADDQSADHVADSEGLSSGASPTYSRSHSVRNLRVDSVTSTEDAVSRRLMGSRSRSFENLHSYKMPQASNVDRIDSPSHVYSGEEYLLPNENGGQIDSRKRDEIYWKEELNDDNKSVDGHIAPAYSGILDEKREAEKDEVKINNLQQESSLKNWDELTSKEFNMRRIEDWINQIDIENAGVVEELGESSCSFANSEPQIEVDMPPPIKFDGRSNLGMEVANNYISSLTATSSSAQMANLGLMALPFLSAFTSLRVLNLSGNAIVRITAGALPRGLHMLNLSKNSIATIEGLRDLTRLRVLDLSYNRIVRIGHGLASCSSLKELYLAGNKISEIEGLHRLLKLNILDLRSNKISTSKGLGQLAANYASLQAINLEGNPAQRNVGDEQLKKYLLSLLPNLTYYNKHAIKASGSKDTPDRQNRSVAAHQFDRGTRTEHKLPRRASHGSGLNKSSLRHVRSSNAVGSTLKQSKSRTEHKLPPLASKSNNNLPDIGKKLVSLKPSNPIRRIQSDGAL